tara:strand:+ start:6308 stop:6616 length:309 start_codon:yes stop_codon:yes gene_type:complete
MAGNLLPVCLFNSVCRLDFAMTLENKRREYAKQQTCRTCHYMNAIPNENGKVIIRKGNAYECKWKLPHIDLPISVRGGLSAHMRWVEPNETGCPVWLVRERP